MAESFFTLYRWFLQQSWTINKYFFVFALVSAIIFGIPTAFIMIYSKGVIGVFIGLLAIVSILLTFGFTASIIVASMTWIIMKDELELVRKVKPDFILADLHPFTETKIETKHTCIDALKIIVDSVNEVVWLSEVYHNNKDEASGKFLLIRRHGGRFNSTTMNFKVKIKPHGTGSIVVLNTFPYENDPFDNGIHLVIIPYLKGSLKSGNPRRDLLEFSELRKLYEDPDYLKS